MKNFNNIKQIIERIPNCLICQKPLMFSVVNSPYHKSEHINFVMRDGLLFSRSRDIKSVINPIDNSIIFDEPVLKNCSIYSLKNYYIKLACKTCFFRTYYSIRNQNSKLNDLCLYWERIQLTLPKNKIINIDYYYDDGQYSYHKLYNEISFRYNYQYIKGPKIDLSKIKNIKQLTHKIKTILTFS